MKKTTLLFMLLTSFSWGQTKKIFHKSHSGKSGTMFLDASNNCGPGEAPVRYQTPESDIQLNYLVSGTHQYPIVKLDTTNKTMRFFDLKDSLLGCNRDYREYLNHGAIVYDIVSREYWAFQNYKTTEYATQSTKKLLIISDSIAVWEAKANYIRFVRSFIRDGNNARIIMSYPMLDHTITCQLSEPKGPVKSYPIIVSEEAKKEDMQRENSSNKKQQRKEKKHRKKAAKIELQENENEEELSPIVSVFSGPNSSLIRWIIFLLLAFSIFIFIGVQRIVMEEVSKLEK